MCIQPRKLVLCDQSGVLKLKFVLKCSQKIWVAQLGKYITVFQCFSETVIKGLDDRGVIIQFSPGGRWTQFADQSCIALSLCVFMSGLYKEQI